MGSSYENQKQIVDTWVKLEKCLDEFDAEVVERKNRPKTSIPAPNKFQINRKRPDSSKFGTNAAIHSSRLVMLTLERPQTAVSLIGRRPTSNFSIGRPMTGKTDIYSSQYGGSSGLNLNKVIHSLPLDQIIALYEARCKDNQVE